MNAGHPISLLIYATFAIVAIVALVLLLRFRRRHDTHPMRGERERDIGEITGEGSSGAADRRP